MKMFRDVNGFSLMGKSSNVYVKFVVIDGVRQAAIYENNDPYPTCIQPLHDEDLYRVAYRYASMCARYEFHPYG